MTAVPLTTPSRAADRTWSAHLELAASRDEGLVVPDGYGRARLLLRLHGQPLGYVEMTVTDGVIRRAAVHGMMRPALRRRAARNLAAERLAMPAEVDPDAWPAATDRCPQTVRGDLSVTVIVCTRDRPAELERCLASLRRITYPQLEVIVVDNASTTTSSQELVRALAAQDARFRLVVEPLPGLSRARNRGLAECTSEIVAYTDDDVTVDDQWVAGLERGFRASPDVGCVTGLVCSASLESPAEAYFDARVSWATDCEPRLYDLDQRRLTNPLYPYLAGALGTGANIAFSRDLLVGIGAFDEALGAGTPAAGGEDLDVFVRVLQSGHVLAYEPSALVWHHHRVTMDALTRQMHAYGSGLSAFVVKHLVDPRTRPAVVRRVPAGASRLVHLPLDTRRALGSHARLPRGLVASEFRGLVAGPVLYAVSRRQARAAGVRS